MKFVKVIKYLEVVKETDKLPNDTLEPVLFGLYGEVGEILSLAKKKKREPQLSSTDSDRLIDELGDTFWYLFCLAHRLNLNIEHILDSSSKNRNTNSESDLLIELGATAGKLLEKAKFDDKEGLIAFFVQLLLSLIEYHDIDFNSVLETNTEKVKSRFGKYDENKLPTFDERFPQFERLPDCFEIEFVKKSNDLQALRWRGVFIGDPLTDNSADEDGYRFHDVFHMSYAAILNWSPVFRALIQHKRKSFSKIDEVQDGGRAKVVEEGISAWIFNIAKDNDFFENANGLTFEILKHVKQAVRGLEVEKCPLSLWEYAILEGYKVFRLIKKNGGGVVIGDRKKRKLSYKERL